MTPLPPTSRPTRRPRRVRAAASALFALAGAAAPSTSSAGLISPGETAGVRAADFSEPRGVLLAEQSVPFTLHFGATQSLTAPGSAVTGTLFDSVYQDPADSTLTFVYNARLDLPPDGAETGGVLKFSRLNVGGFKGFSTDLSGELQGADAAVLARSKDGGTVALRSARGAPGGFPLLVVKTDATDFDSRVRPNSPPPRGSSSTPGRRRSTPPRPSRRTKPTCRASSARSSPRRRLRSRCRRRSTPWRCRPRVRRDRGAAPQDGAPGATVMGTGKT